MKNIFEQALIAFCLTAVVLTSAYAQPANITVACQLVQSPGGEAVGCQTTSSSGVVSIDYYLCYDDTWFGDFDSYNGFMNCREKCMLQCFGLFY